MEANPGGVISETADVNVELPCRGAVNGHEPQLIAVRHVVRGSHHDQHGAAVRCPVSHEDLLRSSDMHQLAGQLRLDRLQSALDIDGDAEAGDVQRVTNVSQLRIVLLKIGRAAGMVVSEGE